MTAPEVAAVAIKALEQLDPDIAKLSWNYASESDAGRDVAVSKTDVGHSITLYPSILVHTDYNAVKQVLVEYGRALYREADDDARNKWDKKLVPATPEQVSLFQGAFTSGAFSSFRELVKSFDRATDKLVALHLSNGLLANGQNITSSNIKVREWGSTSEYARGQRSHSLIPLLSVYAPSALNDFGEALAELALNSLKSVAESSVMADFKRLILGVARLNYVFAA